MKERREHEALRTFIKYTCTYDKKKQQLQGQIRGSQVLPQTRIYSMSNVGCNTVLRWHI